MISVEAALRIILNGITAVGPEPCPIESALGRILSGDIQSPHDQPPWDNSAMDGYAVRWEDLRDASPDHPVTLDIGEIIPAGNVPRLTVSKRMCAKIMTGAQVPPGADTAVPVEAAESVSGKVRFGNAGDKGAHIRKKGEDVRKGECVLKRGKKIRPAEISMLASLGMGNFPVYRKPVAAILSTGDELADLNDPRPEQKIYNSNGYALSALVSEAGGEVLFLGIARDSRKGLLEKLKKGEEADLYVVSGGVSMGDFDYVREILSTHGKLHFWKVAMRPGSPMAFGEWNGRPFFGLPGNPVSCMVTFQLFAAPLIKKMGGEEHFSHRYLSARLEHPIDKRKGMRSYIRGILSYADREWRVRSTGEQGSHLIHSMVAANCLLDLPEEVEHFGPGEMISVLPFNFPLFS